jgi:hypothetical protein
MSRGGLHSELHPSATALDITVLSSQLCVCEDLICKLINAVQYHYDICDLFFVRVYLS